jgi:AraC-like DNA-binding protein
MILIVLIAAAAGAAAFYIVRLKDRNKQPLEKRHIIMAEKVRRMIQEKYGEKLDFKEIAVELGYIEPTLRKFFKIHFGETPSKFLVQFRLEKAKVLLEQTNKTVNEIAYLTGFSDPGLFMQTFKKTAGMTPSQWRKNR